MLKLLLIIIYAAFISLGLPDTILGSAWPVIHQDLNVPISYAGMVTIIVSVGTITSSFLSEKLIRRFGTGKITAFSALLTATGLLGISITPSFIWICLLGIPLGLGAGSIDCALNNFVAINYEAKHMNWLHCFWGIGATTGPFIMSLYLLRQNGWRMGYATIGFIQAAIVLCLFLSLPLWKKVQLKNQQEENINSNIKMLDVLKVNGVKPALLSFFCYCAVEFTTGLWTSSFLIARYGLAIESAAKWVSLYYLGITAGRFLAGFISMKFSNRLMIRMGQIIAMVGAIIIMIKLPNNLQVLGIILIGLGCAPLFPAMIHETPNRFGTELSQKVIGLQMASAYIGIIVVPPVFGVVCKYTGFGILPYFVVIFFVIMLIASEWISKVCKIKTHR